MNCIYCKNHNKNKGICLHGFATKLLYKHPRTQVERDIFEMLYNKNHNDMCFEYCTHKYKPKL
jgi:hypothetical protein